ELRQAFAQAEKTDKGKVAEADHDDVEMEFGDVLFSLVNVARKMGIDSESALRASSSKFRRRWSFIEGAAWAQNRAVEDLSMNEMQALWDEAKARE
ncbi:MAG: MazG nucleotide pyrophosphohydrolase domain-containing protein, partial [Raoultibacter sp.]